jgi:hypothetical protein
MALSLAVVITADASRLKQELAQARTGIDDVAVATDRAAEAAAAHETAQSREASATGVLTHAIGSAARSRSDLARQAADLANTSVEAGRTELDQLGERLALDTKSVTATQDRAGGIRDITDAQSRVNDLVIEGGRRWTDMQGAVAGVADRVDRDLAGGLDAAFSGQREQAWGQSLMNILQQAGLRLAGLALPGASATRTSQASGSSAGLSASLSASLSGGLSKLIGSATTGALTSVFGMAGGPVGGMVGNLVTSLAGNLLGGLFGGRPSVGPGGVSYFHVGEDGGLRSGGKLGDNGFDPGTLQPGIDAILQGLQEFAKSQKAVLAGMTGSLSLGYNANTKRFEGESYTGGPDTAELIASGTSLDQVLPDLLVAAIRKAKFDGLGADIATAIRNSAAKSVAELDADIDFAKGFRTLFDPATLGPYALKLQDLEASFATAKTRAEALTLDVDALSASLARGKDALRGDFMTGVADGIKELTDPLGLQIDRLRRDFEAAKKEAAALGLSEQQTAKLTDLYDLRLKALQGTLTELPLTVGGVGAKFAQLGTDLAASAQQAAASFRQAEASLSIANSSLMLGDLSPLSSMAKQALALREFQDTVALAETGDLEATNKLPQIGETLLKLSRDVYASGPGFADAYELVTATLDRLAAKSGEQAGIQDQIAASAQQAGNTFAAVMHQIEAAIQDGTITPAELAGIQTGFAGVDAAAKSLGPAGQVFASALGQVAYMLTDGALTQTELQILSDHVDLVNTALKDGLLTDVDLAAIRSRTELVNLALRDGIITAAELAVINGQTALVRAAFADGVISPAEVMAVQAGAAGAKAAMLALAGGVNQPIAGLNAGVLSWQSALSVLSSLVNKQAAEAVAKIAEQAAAAEQARQAQEAARLAAEEQRRQAEEARRAAQAALDEADRLRRLQLAQDQDNLYGGGGGGGGNDGGNGGAFAIGGLVTGPGTGTSDSIRARLSNGEYVMQEAMVRRFGVGFFDSLNDGLLPASLIEAPPVLLSAPARGGPPSGSIAGDTAALLAELRAVNAKLDAANDRLMLLEHTTAAGALELAARVEEGNDVARDHLSVTRRNAA